MSELDIQKWLSDLSETVKSRDVKKHMDLISQSITTYGMPNGQVLHYSGWHMRRKHELESGLLKSLSYDKLSIKNMALRRLKFVIEETMDGTNGDHIVINKEIILEHEQDAQWRMVEETIKDWTFSRSAKKLRDKHDDKNLS